MNAYFVDAGEASSYCCDAGGFAHYEDYRLVDIVFAETPGKAKYALWQANRHDLDDLTEMRWHVRLLARDVRHPASILDAVRDGALYDVLWQMAALRLPRRKERVA